MISYVCVGADDMERAERFYSSFLPALGYSLELYHGDLSYIPPTPPGQKQISPDFYVKTPFNEDGASSGNGSMVAFETDSQAKVRELHAAALAAGGTDEGAPGQRIPDRFYGAYARDPDGNKICFFVFG